MRRSINALKQGVSMNDKVQRDTAEFQLQNLGSISRFLREVGEDAGAAERMKDNPRRFLEEERGIFVPENIEVQVHEDTDDTVHVVLPPDPNLMLVDEALTEVAGGKTAASAGSVPMSTVSQLHRELRSLLGLPGGLARAWQLLRSGLLFRSGLRRGRLASSPPQAQRIRPAARHKHSLLLGVARVGPDGHHGDRATRVLRLQPRPDFAVGQAH